MIAPRIAFGGFHIESSTYNPGLSRAADFRILRGAELLASPGFACLHPFDAEFVPLFHARAVPGAPIERATYEGFRREFLGRLAAAGKIDGLYLPLHGAANVEGMDDAEGDFVAAVRAAVGPDLPISVSYDLHGNVSQRMLDAIDMFSAYRTAPHIDVAETTERAVRMLLRRITTGEQPLLCWCPIPVLLQGERTVTTAEPGRGLYGRLAGIETNPAIWDAALMVGFVWADEPRVTAAAVMTGTDRAAMEASAQTLARAYWEAREKFVFGMQTGDLSQCLERALASPTHPVFLSDSGDNVTAGGAGDRVDVLRALLEARADNVLVAGIADAPVTEAAHRAGVGGRISAWLGATLDRQGSRPLDVDAVVVNVLAEDGDEAVLRIDGVTVVVTARRKAFTQREDYRRLDLDPAGFDVVVVKLGYLFPDLQPLANPALMALTEGIVDQDVERLPRQRTPRPTYPFDRDFAFAPQVRWSARSR